MDTKTCTVCKEEKPLSEYHRDGDKRVAMCKPCRNKRKRAYARSERGKQKARENSKRWREKNREKARAACARWEASSKGKAYRKKKYKKDSQKAWARAAVYWAVKAGAIDRPECCTECGVVCTPQGHHPDYSKPLDVVWLCESCHIEEHQRLKRETNEQILTKPRSKKAFDK